MKRRLDRKGFTLLEMLVAMTLMAILAGALYASLNTAFQGRRAAERALEPARRAAAALDMLGQNLEAALPPTGLLAGEFLGEDADGENGEPADRLTFHALAQDQSGARPPYPINMLEIFLSTDDETGETALVRHTTVNLLSPEVSEPVDEVLCQGVRAFDASYFDGSAWTDSWDSTMTGNSLPMAVAVSLTLEGEDGEKSYELSRTFNIPCAGTDAGGGPRAGGPG